MRAQSLVRSTRLRVSGTTKRISLSWKIAEPVWSFARRPNARARYRAAIRKNIWEQNRKAGEFSATKKQVCVDQDETLPSPPGAAEFLDVSMGGDWNARAQALFGMPALVPAPAGRGRRMKNSTIACD
jgi:hypothetical protein